MKQILANGFAKVPEVTLGFWIIKVAATTLGETGGDAVAMSMNLGYLVGTCIFAVIFFASVSAQIAATRFHAFLYWFTIVATTTAGTTLADFLDRSIGIGYIGGSSILFAALMTTLGLWYWRMGSISAHSVKSRKAEAFYWSAIMFSQTLGTALGDFLADTGGLGYAGGALVFGAGLVVLAVLYFTTEVSRTVLFWVASILTLGATVGDFLDKPLAHGGLDLSRYAASGVLAAFIVACVALLPQRASRVDAVA